MNDQQKREQYSGVRDQEIRAALDQHWPDFRDRELIFRFLDRQVVSFQ